VPLHAEIENARDVCKAARGAVEALFREARMGGALDRARIDNAVRIVYSITMQEPITPRRMSLADSRDEIVSVEDPATRGLPPIDQMLA
jgi:hypothetical protein